jgi:hypothetical protein
MPLPPPPKDAANVLHRAVDQLTLRDADPPPIHVFGGNTAGLFEHIRQGMLDQSGVEVLSLNLDGLGRGSVSASSLESRLDQVVGDNDVRERVVAAVGTGLDVLGHGLIEFASR